MFPDLLGQYYIELFIQRSFVNYDFRILDRNITFKIHCMPTIS